MSDDDVQALHRKMDAVLTAIGGNEGLGHKGLAQRMTEAEQEIKLIDRKLIRWGGVVVGIGGVATFLKDWARGS